MNFILNRTFTLTTTTGHSIAFIKGMATHVPPEAQGAAVAIGAIPETDLAKEEAPSREPVIPSVRKAMLMAAIDEIVKGNGREDFSGTGAPHLHAIARIAGFGIDNRERDALWDEYMQGKASADMAKIAEEQARIDQSKADAEAKAKADADERAAIEQAKAKEEADAAAQAEVQAKIEADAAANAAANAAAAKATKPAAKPVGRAAKAKG